METLNSKALRNAMLANCIGVNQLAKIAEMQPVTISRLLKDDSPCRLPTLGKIAKALDIKPTDLIVDS